MPRSDEPEQASDEAKPQEKVEPLDVAPVGISRGTTYSCGGLEVDDGVQTAASAAKHQVARNPENTLDAKFSTGRKLADHTGQSNAEFVAPDPAVATATDTEPLTGYAAKNQFARCPESTVLDAKRLTDRKFADPIVQSNVESETPKRVTGRQFADPTVQSNVEFEIPVLSKSINCFPGRLAPGQGAEAAR